MTTVLQSKELHITLLLPTVQCWLHFPKLECDETTSEFSADEVSRFHMRSSLTDKLRSESGDASLNVLQLQQFARDSSSSVRIQVEFSFAQAFQWHRNPPAKLLDTAISIDSFEFPSKVLDLFEQFSLTTSSLEKFSQCSLKVRDHDDALLPESTKAFRGTVVSSVSEQISMAFASATKSALNSYSSVVPSLKRSVAATAPPALVCDSLLINPPTSSPASPCSTLNDSIRDSSGELSVPPRFLAPLDLTAAVPSAPSDCNHPPVVPVPFSRRLWIPSRQPTPRRKRCLNMSSNFSCPAMLKT